MPSELVVLFCPTCRRDSLAEAPPCADGHGEACPDRACVECGTALLFDAPLHAFGAGLAIPTRAARRTTA